MSDKNKLPAGWAMPPASRKFHYFGEDSMQSFCRSWLFTGLPRDDDGGKLEDKPRKDDCAKCFKIRKAATAEKEKP